MNWLEEINNEFRRLLQKGYTNGKVRLTPEQINNAELAFISYVNIWQQRRILISPSVSVIINITDDLYKQIKKIYPKYEPYIKSHFNLLPDPL